MERVRSALSSSRFVAAGAVAVLLIAFLLRTAGLGQLQIFGDGASSVYFANLPVEKLLVATASDSHPPLYYLALKLSLALFGHNEIAARWISVVCGMLLVAAIMIFARRLAGPRLALAAGMLAAVNPALVYYSRHPRMYAMLALLGFGVLALAQSHRRGRRLAFAEAVIAWLALMTHYFAVIPLLTAVVWKTAIRLSRARQPIGIEGRRLGLALAPFVFAGIFALPWFIFALPASIRHTSSTISGVPPSPNTLSFLESILVFIGSGTLVELHQSELLALACWSLTAGVVYASKRANRALAAFLVTLGAATLVYLLAPAFGRPRFFIVLIPLWILLVVTALALPRRGYRRLAFPAFLAVALVALPQTGKVEQGQFELDAVRLGEQLQLSARDGDIVLLQAWWQAGYLDLHGLNRLRMIDTRDVSKDELQAISGPDANIWLAQFQSPSRNRADGVERWVDDSAYRIDERVFGPTRLVRYAPGSTSTPGVSLRFSNGIELAGTLGVTRANDGDALPVSLTISATQRVSERYVAFLHLISSDGRGWAGRDGEPFDGAEPTSDLQAGQAITERRGLSVPIGTPAGVYSVRAGLYRRGDNTRLSGPDGDELELGKVEITNRTGRSGALASIGGLANLSASWLVREDELAGNRTTIQTVDGPQTLTDPIDARPGASLRVVLLWETEGSREGIKTFVHLLDREGRLVAQHDGDPAEGAYPSSAWQAGAHFSDGHTLTLPGTLTAGEYRLFAGMYGETGSRLEATAGGRRLAGDIVPIRTVKMAE